MQEIISYVLARETLGSFRDFVNSRSLSAPVLVAQTEYTLKLRLFGNADEMSPYPVQNLAKVRYWQFVLDKDFNHSTTPVVEATHAGIFVHTVQDGDNEYTEAVIPLDDMWTEAIQAFIGTSEVSAELCGELRGFGADNSPQFLLQTKGWKLRNFVADRSVTMPTTSSTMKYGYITAADAAGAGMTDVSQVTAALLSSAHMLGAAPSIALGVSVGTLAAGDWVVIALPVGTPFNTATFADGTEFDLSAGGQNGKLVEVSGDSYLVYGQRIPVAGGVSINIDAYYTAGGGSGGGGWDALIVGALTASTATVLGLLTGATVSDGTRSLSDYPTASGGTEGQVMMIENGTWGYGDVVDCTEFSVYANASPIPVGTQHPVLGLIQESPFDGGASLPAQMTCKFALRSETPNAESDVTISWGDGTVTRISTDTLDWTQTDADGEVVNVVAHTYATEGKYKVKVYGRDYFGICHWLGVASQNSNYANDALDYNKECNLLCECFSSDCGIGDNVTNLSSFARCSQRLTKVNVQCQRFLHIKNTANMFLSDWNLSSFSGVGKYIPSTRNCSGMFSDCRNMVSCDYVLPANTNDISALNSVYNNCNRLASDISKLIPTAGFSAERLQMDKTFRLCASLTGKIPTQLLWGDESIDWQNTSTCFYGSSLAGFAPTSWGGIIGVDVAEDVAGYALDLPLEEDVYDVAGNSVKVVQDSSNPLRFTEYDGCKCAFFNGNTALVIPAPDNGAFDFNDKSFTVCFWIAKPSSNQWESVINKRGNSGSADYYFGFNYDNPCFYNGGSAKVSSATLLKNLWHHVAIAVSATSQSATVYVDGVEIGSLGQGSYCHTSDRGWLMIGACCYYTADPSASSPANLVETLHAYVRQLRIYPKVLSASEIATIMRATRTNSVAKVTVLDPETSAHTLLPQYEAYSLDLSQSSSTYLLQCADTAGVEYLWSLDVKLSSSASIQYGSMFDETNSDALTPSKLNRCMVRWDGSKVILKVYARESI